MVTQLPAHLRGERALAEYFESMNLSVESVSVCREVESLKRLLDKRTKALLKLESAWVDYLGNPSRAAPVDSVTGPLVDLENNPEDQRNRLVVPNRKRPTLYPGWFRPKVDALEYLEAQFKEMDEQVLKRRRTGKFKATHAAFVTFESMSSAVRTPHFFNIQQESKQGLTANCGTDRARDHSRAVHDKTGPRTARYHLGEHDDLAKGRACPGLDRHRCHARATVFLDCTRRCPRGSAQLQRDQEDVACARKTYRCECADRCHHTKFVAVYSGYYT